MIFNNPFILLSSVYFFAIKEDAFTPSLLFYSALLKSLLDYPCIETLLEFNKNPVSTNLNIFGGYLVSFYYTAGPYPLAYHGWGDVLVIVFFGFVPVGCTYYVMCHDWTWNVTIASVVCGMIIDTLLMVNNYRDREQDALSGKKTLVVRWGAATGRMLYLFLGLAAAWLCLLFAVSGHIWAAILPQIYILPHFLTWQRMVKINKGKELNIILGETSRNMLLFGILLTLGLIL